MDNFVLYTGKMILPKGKSVIYKDKTTIYEGKMILPEGKTTIYEFK
jgi:hypothetical protein